MLLFNNLIRSNNNLNNQIVIPKCWELKMDSQHTNWSPSHVFFSDILLYLKSYFLFTSLIDMLVFAIKTSVL